MENTIYNLKSISGDVITINVKDILLEVKAIEENNLTKNFESNGLCHEIRSILFRTVNSKVDLYTASKSMIYEDMRDGLFQIAKTLQNFQEYRLYWFPIDDIKSRIEVLTQLLTQIE